MPVGYGAIDAAECLIQQAFGEIAKRRITDQRTQLGQSLCVLSHFIGTDLLVDESKDLAVFTWREARAKLSFLIMLTSLAKLSCGSKGMS